MSQTFRVRRQTCSSLGAWETHVAEMNFAAREQENVFAPKLITPKLTPNF